MMSENPPPLHSTTVQISVNEEPRVLVLRLKMLKTENQKEAEELQSNLDNKVAILSKSTLGQSMIPVAESLTPSLYYSMNSSHLQESTTSGSDSDKEGVEDLFFDMIDDNEGLEVMEDEREALDYATEVVETQGEQNLAIGNLQLLGTHLTQIFKEQGSRIATALIAGGAGISVAATATTIAGPLIAAGTTFIAGKELFNIAVQYINREGAGEHLQMIDAALQNIDKKNNLAKESIQHAQKLQGQVHEQIGEVQQDIQKLENQLQHASGDLKEKINEALINLRKVFSSLMQQSYELENALALAKKSMVILKDQQEQIQSLLNDQYDIRSEEDAKKVINIIMNKIAEIKQSSETAYALQLDVTNCLMKAVTLKKELFVLNHQFSSLFAEIELITKELDEAKLNVAVMGEKVKKAEEQTEQLGQELEKQALLNKEQKQEIDIAKEQLEAEKQTEKFGEQSFIYGGGGTLAIGAGIGTLLLGGPVGMVVGGGAAFLGLGGRAARGIHLARKMMRANEIAKKKLEFEKMRQNLMSNKVEQEDSILLKADYGYSQGHYLGSAGIKAAWNFVGSLANYAAGKEVMSEAKSHRAGNVDCALGSMLFKFEFDKMNENYARYGAISLSDQKNFSEILQEALKTKAISPQMVLNLLNQLSRVHIGHEVIIMINTSSKAFLSLREQCESMIKETGSKSI